MIALDGSRLTLDDLVAIADAREPATLTPAARATVSAAPAVIDHHARGDAAVYGVNTGFGSFAETRIDARISTRCR